MTRFSFFTGKTSYPGAYIHILPRFLGLKPRNFLYFNRLCYMIMYEIPIGGLYDMCIYIVCRVLKYCTSFVFFTGFVRISHFIYFSHFSPGPPQNTMKALYSVHNPTHLSLRSRFVQIGWDKVGRIRNISKSIPTRDE